MVRNVHARTIAASAERVGELIDTLSSAEDRLWPREQWPTMRFDRRLDVGAVGGHTPIRYIVEAYTPGESVRFQFTSPQGFHGRHGFRVVELGPELSELRHELTMYTAGTARVAWPLIFRPLHDALIEESLDRAQAELGSPPAQPAKRSLWVRVLRMPSERMTTAKKRFSEQR